MRLSLGVAVAGFLWAAAAGAAVPVVDPPREGTEKSIADCMKKARVYKDQTLEPSQAITKSHKTPGSAAGSVPPAGGADVSGSRSDASGGSLSNMDLSNLTPAQPTSGPAAYTPQSLNLKASAQTVSSLQQYGASAGLEHVGSTLRVAGDRRAAARAGRMGPKQPSEIE